MMSLIKNYARLQFITVGAIYKHYKFPERDYKVTTIAIQEATEKVCVIYQDIVDPTVPPFVRDLDSWLETVEWQGILVPRFQKAILYIL